MAFQILAASAILSLFVAPISEVSQKDASQIARRLTKAIGVNRAGDREIVRVCEAPGGRQVWEVNRAQWTASIHIRTGALIQWRDNAADSHVLKSLDGKVPLRLTDAKAKAIAERVAKAIAVPSDAYIDTCASGMSYAGDNGMPGYPTYQVVFTRKEGAYGFVAGGKPFCAILIDGNNGAVISIDQCWQIKCSPSEKKVGEKQAKDLAIAAWTRKFGHLRSVGVAKLLKAGYIIPTGEYGGVTIRHQDPFPAFFGYVFEVGGGQVWVSAVDGNILDGVYPPTLRSGRTGSN